MARKPAPSAYILALTLRDAVRKNEEKKARIYKSNESRRQLNAQYRKEGLPRKYWFEEIPEDFTLFWANVTQRLEGLQDISEGLSIIQDADYRAIIFDAVKQPYNKVRKSKGFQNLVPVLETLRRYDVLDERQPMQMTEEEARDLADLIWAQELEKFEKHGLDPINKQIITNKVARELAEANVKYIGEEIIDVQFNDTELDAYELAHEDVIELLSKGIYVAYELFDYDPAISTEENTKWVRHAVCMYNCMLEKDMDDERIDNLVQQIITVFLYMQQLIE